MTMNNQLFDNPDEKLEDALAMVVSGISIEEILAGAGNDVEWLRPLLELAAEVGDLQEAIVEHLGQVNGRLSQLFAALAPSSIAPLVAASIRPQERTREAREA